MWTEWTHTDPHGPTRTNTDKRGRARDGLYGRGEWTVKISLREQCKGTHCRTNPLSGRALARLPILRALEVVYLSLVNAGRRQSEAKAGFGTIVRCTETNTPGISRA